MVPLNLYLETAAPAEAERVVRDYGDAIRELAIANIFPGDLLWRNFGVTRYGRVVFYDYDEIEHLTDCTFRAVPPAPTPEAELSGEPWYPTGPRDVYPEEFDAVLLQSATVREPFLRHHAELLGPEFWRGCQARVAAGEIVDFFPYPESVRLRPAADSWGVI
jgi:isocitrate dehydrogenase kinase/phosphatase